MARFFKKYTLYSLPIALVLHTHSRNRKNTQRLNEVMSESRKLITVSKEALQKSDQLLKETDQLLKEARQVFKP